MKALLIIALISTTAFAGIIEYGPQVGYWAPTGDVGDAYNGNIYIGGQVLVHLPLMAVEGSVGYVALNDNQDLPGFSGHMIPVTAGIRSYMGPLYAAGGIELDMSSVEFEIITGPSEESDSQLGGYIGAGVVPMIPFMADIDASVRLHFIDFSDMWVGVTVGLNF